MNLEAIASSLHLEVKAGAENLSVTVKGGYCGDLLSDVMANSREGDVWITRQIHQNIIAVSSLKDLAGIILVRGAEPAADTLEKAIKEKIPLLISELPAFELAGLIYRMIGAGETKPT